MDNILQEQSISYQNVESSARVGRAHSYIKVSLLGSVDKTKDSNVRIVLKLTTNFTSWVLI